MLVYCGGVSWLQGMSGTFWLMPWQVPLPLATRPPPQVKTATLAASAAPAPLAQLVVSWSFTVGGLVGVPGTMSQALPAESTYTVSPFQYLPASRL
jgi:hypothetical protein